jgi:hypothetical protein
MSYRDAAYQAGQMCVDHFTLDLISRPVSEMYSHQNRMELETVTMRLDGLCMLREFSKATITACTKHAVTKAAAVPASMSDDAHVSTRRASKVQAAAARTKEEETKPKPAAKAAKATPWTASSTADTTGRGQAVGDP